MGTTATVRRRGRGTHRWSDVDCSACFGKNVLLGTGVRDDREHHRQAAREGAADATRMWVEGSFTTTRSSRTSARSAPRSRPGLEDHPVVVQHRGGHTSFYNSRAFELAGVTKSTPNPEGGTFDKDASGELNGRVTDRARNAMGRAGRRPTFTAEQSAQRTRDGLAHISKEFARYGLTTVHHQGGDLAAIRDVRARGELRHRVSYEAAVGC